MRNARDPRVFRRTLIGAVVAFLIVIPIADRAVGSAVRRGVHAALRETGQPAVTVDEVKGNILRGRVRVGYIESIWTLSNGSRARLRLTNVSLAYGWRRGNGWVFRINGASGEWAWSDEAAPGVFARAFLDLPPSQGAAIAGARFVGVTDRIAEQPSVPMSAFQHDPAPGDRCDLSSVLSAFAASRAPRD